jgi:hypothetical protein
MSEGRKPRRKAAVKSDEALTGAPEVGAETAMTPVPIPVHDGPASQLSLDSLDSAGRRGEPGEPQEPAEPEEAEEPDEAADLLVSVSPEALAGSAGFEAEEAGAADGTYEGGLLEDDVDVRTADEAARLSSYEPAGPSTTDQSGLQIRLARIHLRTGSLFMARAELETLAAREHLDTAAHLDLAEARWRTGDLQGAGEAAAAYLADGGHEALGFVIAAEAFAMAGRQAEARQHAQTALERHLTEIDPVFAGMPRRASWPAAAWSSPTAEVATAEVATAEVTTAEVTTAEVTPAAPAAPPAEVPAEPAPIVVSGMPPVPVASVFEAPVETEAGSGERVAPVPEPVAAEAPPAAASTVEAAAVARTPEDAGAGSEVAAGRSFLDAGDPMMAALHFGVAIRLTPVSASAVLEAIGDRQDLPLQLVRGDALRLLGLEVDAGSAYLSVASALGAAKSAAPEPQPEPPEPPPAAPEPEASAPEPPPALHWE